MRVRTGVLVDESAKAGRTQMHELTATQDLLNLALHHARAAGATHIKHLYIVRGEQAHVTEDAVRFYWQQLCPGTPAADAQLHFRSAPAAWACVDCGHRQSDCPTERCPNCGGLRLRPASGHDLYLEAVDVETAETASIPT
jgi:hydrogenase nickel incorporation protein HypA/HybF